MEANDAAAMRNLGGYYYHGQMGFPQDREKAIKLFHRSGELGCTLAYYNLALAYWKGEGVEKDMKKTKYYCELAAMGGDLTARHALGVSEYNDGDMNRALKGRMVAVGAGEENDVGNMSRAIKHWMIAAGAGYDHSLAAIRKSFKRGQATKDEFEMALRAHKEAKDEKWNQQREAAARVWAAGQQLL